MPLGEKISILQACFLQDSRPLEVHRNKGNIILTLPGSLPDEVATVIVLELDTQASEIELAEL